VQPIFDAPMRANDLVEAFGRQDGAEQIIGGLGCCLAGDFADALDLAAPMPPRRSGCRCAP
jgi:hypothetical protein